MAEPRVERPHMPGYGVPETLDGALPWSWAEERFARARDYFLSTTRADGRPHCMPLWGIWLGGRVCFSTAITSVKSENLKRDPRCAISFVDGTDAVIVEGTAEMTPLDDVPGFTKAYKDKYGETIDEGPIWTVKPSVAFAFVEDETFATSATRWAF